MPHSAWALSVNAAQNSENSSEKRHAQTSIAERDRFTAYLLKKVGLTKKEILKIVDEIPDMTDTSTPLPALIPSAS